MFLGPAACIDQCRERQSSQSIAVQEHTSCALTNAEVTTAADLERPPPPRSSQLASNTGWLLMADFRLARDFCLSRPWSERRPVELDPLLNGRSFPLTRCIRRQLYGDFIFIHDEAIQHQCQICVGDTPLTEEVRSILREKAVGRKIQLLHRQLSCDAESRSLFFEEHNLRRALLTDRQQVASEPRLKLARPCAEMPVPGINDRFRKSIVEVLSNRRRLR